jgi:CheY-like chemotaxis protein
MADRKKKKTILLVEDSLVQRLALFKLFKPYDVNVLWAENGKDGLALARQILPEVILLDVHMPGGMDGLEVCRLLRDDTRTISIPIILLTSRNDIETLRNGFLSGAIEFIPKDGFHEAVLLETLYHLHVIDRSIVSER